MVNKIMNHNPSYRFVYYQDSFFYYFWKPAGISSSRGKNMCFLDWMSDQNYNESISNIALSQLAFFGKEKELGLLNRLDEATSGLLYFAKNPKIYAKFREMQINNQIDKYYIAVVYGNIQNWIKENGTEIRFPIMHHKFSDDRMVVIREPGDEKKGKGKMHNVTTEIVEFEYNDKSNQSLLIIKIHKGIRHQIRAHLSSIGYPICGDNIYCKSKKSDFSKMQLFSVGMCIEKWK